MNYQDIIDCVQKATVELKILVESQDYYARRGDYETKTISYVDANRLIEALEQLKDSI